MHEVTRCVCNRRTFEQLKEFADKNELDSAEDLVKRRLCGCGCGMCLPYVKQMMKTGQTRFKPGEIHSDRPL